MLHPKVPQSEEKLQKQGMMEHAAIPPVLA